MAPKLKFDKKTDAEIAKLYKQLGTIQGVAKCFNADRDTIRKSLLRSNVDTNPKQPTVDDAIVKMELQQSKRADNLQLKDALKEIKALRETLDNYTHINDTIKERSIHPPRMDKKLSKQSVMFAPLSDVHFEQKIDRNKTLGREEYNPKIATDRLNKYYDQLPKFAQDVSRRTSVKGQLVHPMLGDMINGQLHNNITGSNWMTPQEAIELLLPILTGGIRYLLDSKQFERIIIPCCVGNHARTTKKPETEMRVETSYEFPLYCRLRDHFRNDDRVEVVVPTEYFNRLILPNGDAVLFHHGDAVKYGRGVGGVLIPLLKYIKEFNSHPEVMGDVVKELNLQSPILHVIGHFHTLIHYPGVVVNGAVIGAGGFAHSGGFAYTQPKQVVFIVHPEYGMTYNMPVVF